MNFDNFQADLFNTLIGSQQVLSLQVKQELLLMVMVEFSTPTAPNRYSYHCDTIHSCNIMIVNGLLV